MSLSILSDKRSTKSLKVMFIKIITLYACVLYYDFKRFHISVDAKTGLYEPRHEKTGFLPERKLGADQLRSNCEADQRLCFR